jgi:hypothetical protein
MKLVNKLFCLALVAFATAIASAQSVAKIPANKPWTLAWDNPNATNLALTCELFYGTNKVATLTTNDFATVGITNNVAAQEAIVPGVPEGLVLVTLRFVNEFGDKSDLSPSLTLTVLGKPLAPQNPRKR